MPHAPLLVQAAGGRTVSRSRHVSLPTVLQTRGYGEPRGCSESSSRPNSPAGASPELSRAGRAYLGGLRRSTSLVAIGATQAASMTSTTPLRSPKPSASLHRGLDDALEKLRVPNLAGAHSGGSMPSSSSTPVSPEISPASPTSAEAASTASGKTSSTAQTRARKRGNQIELKIVTGTPKESIPAAPLFRCLMAYETVEDYYTRGDVIGGGGGLSQLSKAKRKSDGVEIVLKQRKKDGRGDRGWRQMMSQFHSLNKNQNVLRIFEILEDHDWYYIAMPPCDGGELYDLLETAEEIPEKEAKRITCEILAAVSHLHKHDLIHRDIKPENIMFDTNRNDPTSPKILKLIDFDTVSEWTPQSPKTKKFVGTPGYIAPEAFVGKATPQSDLWSVGVILYILMSGDSPWTNVSSLEDGTVGSAKATKAYEQLKQETPDFESDPWPDFPLAKDLCQKLLAFEQGDRPASAQEALAHPWLRDMKVPEYSDVPAGDASAVTLPSVMEAPSVGVIDG